VPGQRRTAKDDLGRPAEEQLSPRRWAFRQALCRTRGELRRATCALPPQGQLCGLAPRPGEAAHQSGSRNRASQGQRVAAVVRHGTRRRRA